MIRNEASLEFVFCLLLASSAGAADDQEPGDMFSYLKVGQTVRLESHMHMGGLYDVNILTDKQVAASKKQTLSVVVKIGRDHVLVKTTTPNESGVRRAEQVIALRAIRSIILTDEFERTAKP